VLYSIFALMLAAAAVMLLWPLYRRERRISSTAISVLLVLLALTPLLYLQIGSPHGGPAAESVPSIEEMTDSLAARLKDNPQDIAGWKMLGRSLLQLRRLPESIAAFEKAVELESGRDAQTLADLGEAIFMNDQSSITARAGQLFETALSIAPGNPKALFYAGLVAINRGDSQLGADRWEALLASPQPKEIEDILRTRIAELRGEPPPSLAAMADSSAEPGLGISIDVELSTEAESAVLPDATVFVIARDPAQPSPPIAAVRRRAAELPAVITLSDADAMIPGRVPSAFAELELIARVSMSGNPIAQSGDWFGTLTIQRGNSESVRIRIDQQVP